MSTALSYFAQGVVAATLAAQTDKLWVSAAIVAGWAAGAAGVVVAWRAVR